MPFKLSVGIQDVNMGFYVARPTNGTKRIFNAITELQKYSQGNDQDIANRIFQRSNQLLWRYGHALDKMLFTDGEVYYHHKMSQKLGVRPLTFHVNYFVGFEKKKNVLIEEGMWYL